MQTVMSHKFSEVPHANINRSSFDRSHGYKTTFDAGLLIPILVDEALPGDTFNLNMDGFARMATPIFPLMDNAYMDTHFFAVPIRLIWYNWEHFNGAQDNPGDSTDYLIPQTGPPASGQYEAQSLSDYMGIPTAEGGFTHSALWHRAYNLIYNDWYRDENLQSAAEVHRGDGPDNPNLYQVMRRGKRHDYFTSCLPFPQKGPESSIPLIGTIPVESKIVAGQAMRLRRYTDGSSYTTGTNLDVNGNSNLSPTGDTAAILDPHGTLVVNLQTAQPVGINKLREAFAIQHVMETNARAGTRYTEIIKAHFGVTSPDSRLQRSEYLGGGSSPIIITPIEQTSSTDSTSPQGNLAAYGTAELRNHGFTKSFTEHCVIIGIVSVRADLTYQQGLDRMWSRKSVYDFYVPALANLGEQAVLNKEIYLTGSNGGTSDDAVFGYQERWAEYRYKPSKITGKFRSNYPQSLDSWHLSQHFSSVPTLSESFIQENPPFDRVIAVPSEPHFIFDSYFRMKCARPMPMYSIPGLNKL